MTTKKLGRKDRLKKETEFQGVYQEGASVHTPYLVVFLRENDLGRRRLGVAVGRKHGDAVRRNRLKRLLREAFRHERESLPGGVDVVLVPRKDIPPEAGVNELRRLLRQAAGCLAEGRKHDHG